MSAVTTPELRTTLSLTLHEWIDPTGNDPLSLLCVELLHSNQTYIQHELLQIQHSATTKDINYHLIGKDGQSSYHITPTHIWKKIKKASIAGTYKKKKRAEDFAANEAARLVIFKLDDTFCPIREYNIQKLFAGKRGIVTVYDLIKSHNSKNKLIYTLYAENYNLGDIAECSDMFETLSDEEFTSIAEDLIIGLQTMHTAGYAHCDIKAENVLLSRNSQGILKAAYMDFGFTKKASPTTPSRFQGTPEYIPPEKWAYVEWVIADELIADIWALGLLLYIIRPETILPDWFSEETPAGIKHLILESAKSEESFITQEECSTPMMILLRKMCQYNPKNRPTIDQVYQEFQQSKSAPCPQ